MQGRDDARGRDHGEQRGDGPRPDDRPVLDPVIDMHAHVFPDTLAPTALAALQGQSGLEPVYDGTTAGLAAAMARAGVARSVIQPVASKPSQVRSINDWLAGLADPRLSAFGALHPDLADPVAELARLQARGVCGVKLHPEFQSFRPDDERLDSLYEGLARRGLVVFFHAGKDIAIPTVHSDPACFARVLDRHPGLVVVLAHMGGWRQWDDVERDLAGRDVYLDTAFSMSDLGARGFCRLVAAVGAERVLFGSDGPWGDAAAEIALLAAMPLPGEAREAILWGNAARLLQTTRIGDTAGG